MTNETKSAIFEKYKEWRLLTDEEKINKGFPLTMRDFAITHGVSHQTLYNWNDKIDAEAKQVDGDFLNGKAKNVDEALVKACEKGNAQALRTYYQLTQRLIERKEETHKFELTPADYASIGIQLREGLQEEYRQVGGNCPVCGKPKEVCNEPRLATRPEQAESGEMATLALLARPD